MLLLCHENHFQNLYKNKIILLVFASRCFIVTNVLNACCALHFQTFTMAISQDDMLL